MSVSRKGSNACFGNLLRLELRANPASEAIKSVAEYRDASNVGTKLLFQDEFVNIWEFRLEPQEKCHFHVHKLRYCFTNLTESITQAMDENGEKVESPNPQTKGQTIYVDRNSLGSHAVLNVGATTFLQFIIEFKF